MRAASAILLAFLAAPALAEGPDPSLGQVIGADAFEALVAGGLTLAYGAEGAKVPRGVETYGPNRTVTWLEVATGECIEGRWHGSGTPEAPQICFAYENRPGKQCYYHYLDGERMVTTNLDGSFPEVSLFGVDTDGIACEYLGS